MLQHWSLHPIPDRNQAEVCESAACSYTRAVLKVQCVLTEDPGKWQWTWTRGSWWQCKAFLQGTLGKKKWTWTASSYNGFFICSTVHKCLVVKVKQWYQNGSVLGQKKTILQDFEIFACTTLSHLPWTDHWQAVEWCIDLQFHTDQS